MYALERGALKQWRTTYLKNAAEGLVKLKTRVKALTELRRDEREQRTHGEQERETEKERGREKTIDRPRCATFADLISAHHARVAADVRCHLAGNCYRFKLIGQYCK